MRSWWIPNAWTPARAGHDDRPTDARGRTRHAGRSGQRPVTGLRRRGPPPAPLTARASLAAWGARCAGLRDGSIAPLGSSVSERAADELYVASAGRLAGGLAAVLDGYAAAPAGSQRAAIYAVWAATGRERGVGA